MTLSRFFMSKSLRHIVMLVSRPSSVILVDAVVEQPYPQPLYGQQFVNASAFAPPHAPPDGSLGCGL